MLLSWTRLDLRFVFRGVPLLFVAGGVFLLVLSAHALDLLSMATQRPRPWEIAATTGYAVAVLWAATLGPAAPAHRQAHGGPGWASALAGAPGLPIAARLASAGIAGAAVTGLSLLSTGVLYMQWPPSVALPLGHAAVAAVVTCAWAVLADRWGGPSVGVLAGVAAAALAQVAAGAPWAPMLPPTARPAPPAAWLGPLLASAGCALLAAAPRGRVAE